MLTEVSLKSKRKKEIEDWISQFKETVENIPESSKYPVGFLFRISNVEF